ncbi:MAG TPA: DUF5317 family protein [Actinomycetota bacterium]
MLVIGAFLAIGLLLGWGLNGGLRYLDDVRVRGWWLAPLALALQVAPAPTIEADWGRYVPAAMLALSFVVLLLVVAVNLRNRGFGLILFGLMLNLAVILVSRGMPVSAYALEEIGAEDDIERLARAQPGAKHHLATDDDLLRFIGDAIPVRSPFDAVLSPGDVLMYTGGAWFLVAAMRGRSRRDPELDDSPDPNRTATRY